MTSLKAVATSLALSCVTLVAGRPLNPSEDFPSLNVSADMTDRPGYIMMYKPPQNGKIHMESFHGINDDSRAPQSHPFSYPTKDIDWINFVKVDSDKQMDKNIINFPGGHRQTQVAAIGGIVDTKGRAVNNTMAMMVIQAHSNTEMFDIDAFDFFCLDGFHIPTYCKMGVATSQKQNLLLGHDRLDTFEFHPDRGPRARVQQVILRTSMMYGLTSASFGLPLARLTDEEIERDGGVDLPKLFVDGPMAIDGVTLYIDNIIWTSYPFAEDRKKVVLTKEFNGCLNQILHPIGFGYPAPNATLCEEKW